MSFFVLFPEDGLVVSLHTNLLAQPFTDFSKEAFYIADLFLGAEAACPGSSWEGSNVAGEVIGAVRIVDICPALPTDGLAASGHAYTVAGRAVAGIHATKAARRSIRLTDGEEEEHAENSDSERLMETSHFDPLSITKVREALEA